MSAREVAMISSTHFVLCLILFANAGKVTAADADPQKANYLLSVCTSAVNFMNDPQAEFDGGEVGQ